MQIRIFKTASAFRTWLQKNHARKTELWLGMYNQRSGKTSITYKQALDEALCFGWIDGVRKSIDESSYTVRFTPRKTRSYWSRVNLRRMEELIKLERVAPSGVETYRQRDQRTRKYSFENKDRKLDPPAVKKFKLNPEAWRFFVAQAPWYKRTASFWVVSAKKEETRARRLETLIADSAKGRPLAMLTPKSKAE